MSRKRTRLTRTNMRLRYSTDIKGLIYYPWSEIDGSERAKAMDAIIERRNDKGEWKRTNQ